MEYKCPCCGGGIEFNSTIQKMKCPYCETEFDMDTLKSFDEELKQDKEDDFKWNTDDAGMKWMEGEADSLNMYQCQSCGAQIFADETLSASKCPYCDNPIVMKQQFAGDLKPDYVIPFKYDKAAAKEKYRSHLSGKKFLPKVFLDDNHIDEIKGVYVPFWLYDSDANANIRYKGTKTRMWSDSKYEYTETSYYSIVRAGDIGFDSIPVRGTSKLDSDLMESIEPFDIKDAVPFQSAYLAGYLADRYDIDAASCEDRANSRVKKSTEQAFRNTVSGYNIVETNSSISLTGGAVKYALYPVWILNTTWNDQKFIFAMNGQTGKMVGNLPCDKSVATKHFMKIFLIGGVVLLAVARLLGFFI